MISVSVPGTPEQAYPVAFVPPSAALPDVTPADFVLTDENVWAAHSRLVPSGSSVKVVPAGERSKSLEVFRTVIEAMTGAGISRQGRVFAFGGGVVGDLGGYVAASYMRGIDLVQVPTSLLAMVDSSVGGKVGIDVGGKNNVGAFHHPREVRVSAGFLSSLPEVEFKNGMAEVVKYACILSPRLFGQVVQAEVKPSDEGLQELIRDCIELKKKVVEADPNERTGERATLNFGHTFGHALETFSNYTVKHGYAVAVGMVMEAHLATHLGLAEKDLPKQVERALTMQGLPTSPGIEFDAERLLDLMRQDKKATGNDLSFALVCEVGRCKLVHGISAKDVKAVMERLWP